MSAVLPKDVPTDVETHAGPGFGPEVDADRVATGTRAHWRRIDPRARMQVLPEPAAQAAPAPWPPASQPPALQPPAPERAPELEPELLTGPAPEAAAPEAAAPEAAAPEVAAPEAAAPEAGAPDAVPPAARGRKPRRLRKSERRRRKSVTAWRQDHSRGAAWATAGTAVMAINAVAAGSLAFGWSPVHVHLHFLPPTTKVTIPYAASLATGPPLTVPAPTTTVPVPRPALPTSGPLPAIAGFGSGGGVGTGGGGGTAAAHTPSGPPAGTRLADGDTRDAVANDVPPLSGTTVDYIAVSKQDPAFALEHLVGDPEIYRILQLQASGWTMMAEGAAGSVCANSLPATVVSDFSPVLGPLC